MGQIATLATVPFQVSLNLAEMLQGLLHIRPFGAYTALCGHFTHFTSLANMALWLSGDQKDGRGLFAFTHSWFG